MDDWTYHDSYRDVDVPDTQLSLLNQDGLAIEARRARAQRAEAARCAELKQPQALDAVVNPAETDVPLPFATPPGAALTF